MTLSFSTKINGKETLFVDKILEALIGYYVIKPNEFSDYVEKYIDNDGCVFHFNQTPKIHTIREDKSDRWKVGSNIHFVINNRTPDRLQFAPVVPVISIQTIEIKNMFSDRNAVFIDGLRLTKREVERLAKNDGFESSADFWDFFNWQDFKGKLIH